MRQNVDILDEILHQVCASKGHEWVAVPDPRWSGLWGLWDCYPLLSRRRKCHACPKKELATRGCWTEVSRLRWRLFWPLPTPLGQDRLSPCRRLFRVILWYTLLGSSVGLSIKFLQAMLGSETIDLWTGGFLVVFSAGFYLLAKEYGLFGSNHEPTKTSSATKACGRSELPSRFIRIQTGLRSPRLR